MRRALPAGSSRELETDPLTSTGKFTITAGEMPGPETSTTSPATSDGGRAETMSRAGTRGAEGTASLHPNATNAKTGTRPPSWVSFTQELGWGIVLTTRTDSPNSIKRSLTNSQSQARHVVSSGE